ncbi:MAG: hemerythrin family protein [Bacteroidia bacterium]|nr:hemerythrin family protein [Bacteroidia bacterium]
MAYIVWKDSFDIGVPEMDYQHKLFVSYINELHKSIQFGYSKLNVVITLKKLADYIEVHFVEEEKLLISINYPMLEVQIKQHAYFISELASMKNTYMSKTQTANNMLIFMKDWFLHHITTEDIKYAEFI